MPHARDARLGSSVSLSPVGQSCVRPGCGRESTRNERRFQKLAPAHALLRFREVRDLLSVLEFKTVKHLLRNAGCCSLVVLFALGATVATAQEPKGMACPSLAALGIEDTNLLSAAVVPESDDLPGYCRVLGYVRPAINFEIRLPTSDWNGKFYMTGCGMHCGGLGSRDIAYGLSRNYAAATTDSGHWGEFMWDGRWAYNNPVAEIDWAYRAIHETTRVAKVVVEAYYGQVPGHSYFDSCSTGGRMAHMEAYRYPEDFDGVISGAPAFDVTGLDVYVAWLTQANTNAQGQPLITADDVGWIAERVQGACDEQDGLADGLVSDPRSCVFDPATLACGKTNEAQCLSLDQISTLEAWCQRPSDSNGTELFSQGVPLGSEVYWVEWIVGRENAHDGYIQRMVEESLRYVAFPEDPGESYSIMDFDMDTDPARLEQAAARYNSNIPDLTGFRERGGKLLMWHGWADAIIPPATSLDYYEAIERRVGSRADTQEFLRLFMIPGMDHCGILEGPGIQKDGFDRLTALERWVEQGEAPSSLLTTKTDSAGNVLWTRPVCPYPQHAEYVGHGDMTDASSFECVDDD